MKALVTIEFILSLAIFLSAISFIALTINSRIPLFEQQSALDNLLSEGYQITDLIMFSEGEPRDWETDVPNSVRVGLSSGEDYTISTSKLDALDAFCNDPDPSVRAANLIRFYDMFSESKIISMRVYSIDESNPGNTRWICEGAIPAGASKFKAERYAMLNNADREIVNVEFLIIG
jgi:hypothetical protein